MENVVIVITARVNSKRIPEKVLQKIDHRRSIEVLFDHVVNPKYPVILAIRQNKEDDILEEIATDRGIQVYRGYDDSPMHRLFHCAYDGGFEHVVRVTTDDILIDLTILMNQIRFHVNGGHDYTFCRRIPEGCAAEVISIDALEKVINDVGNKSIEFVSYYLKNKFKTFEYYPHSLDFQKNYRLTMDYPEDLMLLKILFASMVNPGTLDIINFLKKYPYFSQINHLPSVTVYTCNYNTSKYVTETIRSVLNQSYQDFEYIVIDDCSTDESMNVLSEFYTKLELKDQSKIKILRNDKNIGLPATCNKVLEIARGKYIVRIDSDDVIDREFLRVMVDNINIDESHGVISSYRRIDESGNAFEEVHKNDYHPGCALLSKWVCNELKFKENLKYLEGAEFFERFNKKYKLTFVDNVLWGYRKRDGQKTQSAEHPNNK